jgi:hypothetical protein
VGGVGDPKTIGDPIQEMPGELGVGGVHGAWGSPGRLIGQGHSFHISKGTRIPLPAEEQFLWPSIGKSPDCPGGLCAVECAPGRQFPLTIT